jgi:hypothetical protein
MEWNRFYAPRALNRLLEAGILPRVTYRPFSIRTADGTVLEVERGSIFIPLEYRLDGARYSPEDVHRLVQEVAREDHVVIHALNSGWPEGEVWPGGAATQVLDLPRIALLAGRGSAGYAVGETWHLLNERMGIPVSLVDVADVAGLDLSRYNTLVMAGNIGGLSEAASRNITEWVRGGGLLITTEGAARWPIAQGLLPTTIREANVDLGNPSYADRADRAGAQVIGGSIFQVELDPTHPIAFGYGGTVPTFRSHNLYLEPVSAPGVTVGRYAPSPLISGYIHEAQIPFLEGSASILAGRAGQGRVVSFLDNPNFRAFWHGTNHLFLNAVFFGRGY